MRQPRIVAVASAVDLDFRYGCTPAWWQLLKGLYEVGVDLVGQRRAELDFFVLKLVAERFEAAAAGADFGPGEVGPLEILVHQGDGPLDAAQVVGGHRVVQPQERVEHARHLQRVDVGAGERVVFLPYTRDTYERSQEWMRERRLFEDAPEVQDFASVVEL